MSKITLLLFIVLFTFNVFKIKAQTANDSLYISDVSITAVTAPTDTTANGERKFKVTFNAYYPQKLNKIICKIGTGKDSADIKLLTIDIIE
jgi:hypothetical protein